MLFLLSFFLFLFLFIPCFFSHYRVTAMPHFLFLFFPLPSLFFVFFFLPFCFSFFFSLLFSHPLSQMHLQLSPTFPIFPLSYFFSFCFSSCYLFLFLTLKIHNHGCPILTMPSASHYWTMIPFLPLFLSYYYYYLILFSYPLFNIAFKELVRFFLLIRYTILHSRNW